MIRAPYKCLAATGRRYLIVAAVLTGGLAAADSSLAQSAGAITVDIERCLALESEQERRECFAARVDEVLLEQAETGTGNETATAGNETAAARAAPNDSRADQTEDEPEEFFGTIVEMRERLPNAFIVTLDNGQIWEQTEPKRYPLRPGLEVRIYPTRWGSRYRLAGLDSGGHIQVRRLR